MEADRHRILSIEELIEDQGYINVVLERASESEQMFWSRYESEHPDQADALQEARIAISTFAGVDREVDESDMEDVRTRLMIQIEPIRRQKKILWTKILKVAAVFIGVLLVGSFLFQNDRQTWRTANQEIQQIDLPDGSKVVLNAASKLSYKKSSFNKSNRILNLDGQAFFNVVKGKSFVVKTERGEITVLGTSFDVFQRNGELIVACETGKVQVIDHSNHSTILSPGQEVYMSETKMNKIKKSLDKIGCWGKGTFYYESVRLRKILDEVERQFNAKIICQPAGLGEQMYSGYFINTHLDSALMSICWPLRIQYEHGDSNIIVSRQ